MSIKGENSGDDMEQGVEKTLKIIRFLWHVI
jgi:hypothetical protein